jgi:hypothetical protein
MTVTQEGEPTREPIRLWPGVVAVTLQWIIRFGLPLVSPDAIVFALIGGLVGALAVLIWWAFFSRVPRLERWGALALMVVGVLATPPILHPSIVGGMMGMMFRVSVIPGLCLALVVWAAISSRLAAGPRRAALVAVILIACGAWALVRTDGITGNGHSQFAWRWKKTHEQQLLARAEPEPLVQPAVLMVKTPEAPRVAPPEIVPPRAAERVSGDWPGFRGLHRDGVVTGVRIKTDWASSPPVELWRHPVGPGWSSFAVHDGLIYTQEQRGDFELVSCYDAATGKPVWTHRDAARFWESNAGAGPRGTPTFHNGRLYTFGATGILNALDAGTGALAWTHNAAADTGAKLPGWGFSSSPLVVGDLVIVAAAGRLAAYSLAGGALRWLGPQGGGSYSSPQLLNIGGEEQVLLLSGAGATSVSPADGSVLWKHPWGDGSMLQPAMTADGGVLITGSDMSGGIGMRRLAVARGPAGWTAEEAWTSRGLKPYFNDFVVHKSHAFGFDGAILACIDLHNGTRKWKGGRYGNGQLLLLADQDLLLVTSEEGEVALVAAVPDKFTEIARFPAIEGKTWNHPAMAGEVLLVRNGQEMAAFRLTP